MKTPIISLCAMLLALCGAASAQTWILDGKKILTVHDPAGLRSQIGAVANASGQATNLTVADTLTVSGVVGETTAIISGTDAGDYAGEYHYAGTDEYYGDCFTNSTGRFLFTDADYWFGGEFALGMSVGAVVYGNLGTTWCDTDYSEVDIVMTGTPDYGVTGGKISASSFHGPGIGELLPYGDANYAIGNGAGGTNTYTGAGDSTQDPSGSDNVWIGIYAGASAQMRYSLGVGPSAGLGAGDDTQLGNCFIGTSAGRSSMVDGSTCIGSGAGWGASGNHLLIIDQFTSDAEARFLPSQTNSTFYFNAASKELSLGRPDGNIRVRGANVITGTIVTNLVQQKDGSGFVTNIVLQGIAGRIIE